MTRDELESAMQQLDVNNIGFTPTDSCVATL